MQKRVLVLLLLLIVLLPAAGCSKQPAESKASSKLTVYTSFFPSMILHAKSGAAMLMLLIWCRPGQMFMIGNRGPKHWLHCWKLICL